MEEVKLNNMQDIPRNELLNKLADGWNVRRKSWREGRCFSKSGGNTSISGSDLVEDDWQGMSTEPRLRNDNQTLSVAIAYLKDGATFIRRKDWDNFQMYEKGHAPFELSIDDIFAADWEVWE